MIQTYRCLLVEEGVTLRKSTIVILVAAFAVTVILTFIPTSRIGKHDTAAGLTFDFDPAVQLLDLLDTLVSTSRRDEAVTTAVDRLLSSNAYSLYYRQFRNMNPDKHREILLALPSQAIPSPAGISDNLLEALNHRVQLRGILNDLKSSLDGKLSVETARRWLPSQEFQDPQIQFIIDGNGDAFAREEGIIFDIWGVVLSKRDQAVRFEALTEAERSDVQATIAHELHHFYSRQCHEVIPSDPFAKVTYSIVSEGLAMHCNPPSGIKLEVMTDTAIVRYWIHELAAKRELLRLNEISPEEFSSWRDSTYHDLAKSKLIEYLSHSASGDQLRQDTDRNITARPSMIYTLGWWMVEQISNHGRSIDSAIPLVFEPDSIYVWYNRSIETTLPELKFPI